jgi:hypothetical protein
MIELETDHLISRYVSFFVLDTGAEKLWNYRTEMFIYPWSISTHNSQESQDNICKQLIYSKLVEVECDWVLAYVLHLLELY